jgi:carbon monoxide dehydrogenase subunit G
MKNTTIKRQVKINASKGKVWDALADFGNVQQMSPNIVKSYIISDENTGLGAQRHCDFAQMGASVDEKIIEWNEGESMRIQLYNPKKLPMINEMEAFFQLESQDENTLLKGTFEYNMTGAMGNIMNGLLMKKMNIKTWVTFMAGIKEHVETGEKIDKKSVLNLAAVGE